MRVSDLKIIEDHIQGVLMRATLDMNTKELRGLELVPIVGNNINIKDLNFFVDELDKFRKKINKLLEAS
jgi:hypothetical protein